MSELVKRPPQGGSLLGGDRGGALGGIQGEAEGDGDGADGERDEGKGHVGVLGTPLPVTGFVEAAGEEESVGAADEDETGADDSRGGFEPDVGGQRHLACDGGGPLAVSHEKLTPGQARDHNIGIREVCAWLAVGGVHSALTPSRKGF